MGGLEKNKEIKHFRDLLVYRRAFEAAMTIFQLTKEFPSEERYSLVDQIRRASRSVCSNLSEAWRRRRILPYSKTKSQIQCKRHQRLNAGWSSVSPADI